MPPLVPSTVAEVRVMGKLHGQDCINVWHVGSAEQFVDFDQWEAALLALAAAMLACVVEQLLPGVTSDFRVVSVQAKMLYPTLTDYFVATAAPEDVGQLGPTSVSFASTQLNLRSGRDGRRGRGKKFLPPPGEANMANSLVDGPTLAQIADFIECIVGKFVGGGATTPWRLGVLSRKTLTGIGGNYPAAFKELVSVNPVALAAKMGSRKVDVGD
jgi:hypothetical protein